MLDPVMQKTLEITVPTVIGILCGYFLRSFFAAKRIKSAEQHARELRERAERETETHKKESEIAAKDMLLKLRQDFEKETLRLAALAAR